MKPVSSSQHFMEFKGTQKTVYTHKTKSTPMIIIAEAVKICLSHYQSNIYTLYEDNFNIWLRRSRTIIPHYMCVCVFFLLLSFFLSLSAFYIDSSQRRNESLFHIFQLYSIFNFSFVRIYIFFFMRTFSSVEKLFVAHKMQ